MADTAPMSFRDLDGRTKPVRRAKFLELAFVAALGGMVADHQRILIRRVAELIVISEQTRVRYLGGAGATVDDVVRAENAVARATAALNLPAPTTAAKPSDPARAAQEWLHSLATDDEAAS